MDNQRSELIRDLATSFGMQDRFDSKINGARFDAGTGTLYCDGIAIPKTTVEKAKSHFQTQMDYYRSRADSNNDARDMFLMCTVAYNAICMLEDNVNK